MKIFKVNKHLDTVEILNELKELGYSQMSCSGNHPDGHCSVNIYDEVEWDQDKEDAVNAVLNAHNKEQKEADRNKWEEAKAWAKRDLIGKSWSSLKTYHQNLWMNIPDSEWASQTKTTLLNDYDASQE